MNQPSAEELIASFYESGDGHLPHKIIAQRILDRYHLIDKTEPIPGAVSADTLLDQYTKMTAQGGLFVATILDRFDIYPKGTVARLITERDSRYTKAATAHIKELQAELDIKIDANLGLLCDIDRLKAEVDRLKVDCQTKLDLQWEAAKALEAERDRLVAEIDQLKGEQLHGPFKTVDDMMDALNKPEAVGCGKEAEVYKRIYGVTYICGENWKFPDCQAKSSDLEKLERLKPKLPHPEMNGQKLVLNKAQAEFFKRSLYDIDEEFVSKRLLVEELGKVVLPEVPWLTGSSNRKWAEAVSKFLRAVKARLDG